MTNEVLAIALSQAAFGAVTLMFIAYSTVVANNVDARDVDRQKKQEKKLRKAKILGVPTPICYVHEGREAQELSRALRQFSTVLAGAYVFLLCVSTWLIAPEWLSWSFVQSTATAFRGYGFAPHDPAILYTVLVVALAWRLKWRCGKFFAAGRDP